MSTPSPNGIAEIVALANLISTSVTQLVDEYPGHVAPSLSSTQPGPFDTPDITPPKVAKIIRTIEAACAQLTCTVASPGHVMLNKCYGAQEPACLLVAADAKIADHLLDQPEGVHVDELARKSGYDGDKLARVLRLLATRHCFTEGSMSKPNVFANNRLSLRLVSSDPIASFIGHVADEGMKASWLLNENLADPETTSSVSPNGSAFKRAHGVNLFEFYQNPEHEKHSVRFGRAMLAWGEVTGNATLPKDYPWASLPAGTSVCDFGGGNGHITAMLLKAVPHLKFVLQDLPPILEQGKEFLATQIPHSVLKTQVQFVPVDFFKESPVQGCDIYYVRHILHDWPNPACLQILESIRKAVKPSSRLLIHDLVLQNSMRDAAYADAFDTAPEPLLSNYGVANIRPFNQDVTMMAFLNSKERTLQEFIELGTRSGFRFVKLWPQGELGLLEFEVVSSSS
ncbi:S-adenosyl-L-methionine-dependent methyltransferase [Mycena leptocephala]|nr:S-adenosyl-L-methionine-dependent methyltransferase [Mycena leptocephala]